MKYSVCAVKDRAVDAFNRPLYVPTIGVAIRSFTDECNKKDSELNIHPEDYDFYELGQWDDQTAVFIPLEVPRVIARAQDIVIKE
jgi:hypothetical protein